MRRTETLQARTIHCWGDSTAADGLLLLLLEPRVLQRLRRSQPLCGVLDQHLAYEVLGLSRQPPTHRGVQQHVCALHVLEDLAGVDAAQAGHVCVPERELACEHLV